MPKTISNPNMAWTPSETENRNTAVQHLLDEMEKAEAVAVRHDVVFAPRIREMCAKDYESKVGVPPWWRHELRSRIEDSILAGEDLDVAAAIEGILKSRPARRTSSIKTSNGHT